MSDAYLMRTLSPMTSIGRRGSGSTIASDINSEVGSIRSARRLLPPHAALMRSASPAVDINLSDVWVPPDIQRVGSPSGSHLVVVPTPEILRLNEVPEATAAEEISRWRMVTQNTLGAVGVSAFIALFFYGIYMWVKNGQNRT